MIGEHLRGSQGEPVSQVKLTGLKRESPQDGDDLGATATGSDGGLQGVTDPSQALRSRVKLRGLLKDLEQQREQGRLGAGAHVGGGMGTAPGAQVAVESIHAGQGMHGGGKARQARQGSAAGLDELAGHRSIAVERRPA